MLTPVKIVSGVVAVVVLITFALQFGLVVALLSGIVLWFAGAWVFWAVIRIVDPPTGKDMLAYALRNSRPNRPTPPRSPAAPKPGGARQRPLRSGGRAQRR